MGGGEMQTLRKVADLFSSTNAPAQDRPRVSTAALQLAVSCIRELRGLSSVIEDPYREGRAARFSPGMSITALRGFSSVIIS